MPYFTTDELRSLPDVDEPNGRFQDDRLEAAHDWIASIIERECDTSFIPVEVTETLTGGGSGLFLSSTYVLSIDDVSVDDAAVAIDDIYSEHGVLYYLDGTCWSTAGRRNVTVTYTAGYSETPPPDLKEAALRAARNWLLTMDVWSAKDSRATSISNEYGNYALSVAGDGRPTGLPDVDATIMAWARRVRVPKVS